MHPLVAEGGVQLHRPKLIDLNIIKQSHTNQASYLQLGSSACSRAMETFMFSMLKYVLSDILETAFLSF